MPEIERIEKKSRSKRVFNVFFGSGEKLEIHEEILIKYRFEAGKILEESTLKEAEEESDYINAKEAALKYLKTRNRSLSEISSYLEKKGFERSVYDKVIGFVKDYGFADDRFYAEHYIMEALRKGFGELKIRFDLESKGIDNSIIERYIQKHLQDDKAYIQALEMAKKKYASEPWNEKTKARIGRFLLSKGYKEETIFKVLEAFS